MSTRDVPGLICNAQGCYIPSRLGISVFLWLLNSNQAQAKMYVGLIVEFTPS